MVKPYSEDLRVRVVDRVEAGHPVREVAKTFRVSVSSVVKWSQRKRQTGSATLPLAAWRVGTALPPGPQPRHALPCSRGPCRRR